MHTCILYMDVHACLQGRGQPQLSIVRYNESQIWVNMRTTWKVSKWVFCIKWVFGINYTPNTSRVLINITCTIWMRTPWRHVGKELSGQAWESHECDSPEPVYKAQMWCYMNLGSQYWGNVTAHVVSAHGMKILLSGIMFFIFSWMPFEEHHGTRTCLISSLSNFKYQCCWKEMDVIQELGYTLELLKKKKRRRASDGLSSPKSQT